MHKRFLWTRFVMFALGFWLMVTPATFAQHSSLVTYNDIICGLCIMVFSLFSLSFHRLWAPWILCGIGVWLEFAPLIFWAPNAVGYLNDTSIGSLLILLSVIIPGTPGGVEIEGAEIPPGWSYNPSSWNQRLPIILLAFFAWMSARYMAAFQLGYMHTIWDPFFKEGTQKVITSSLSSSFPISDAGLGALVYTFEVLMGFKGSTRRWYTMPWMVFLFGVMVVPAGFVSILLIMLQPLIVGYWCTWCLLTAICMLIMIALTLDEVVAVCQYLAHVKRSKYSLWSIFWKGGSYQDGDQDLRSPPLNVAFKKNLAAMRWGISFPWNLILSILLGGLLMFAPTFIAIYPPLASSDYIIGALVVTISFISVAEVLRIVRFLNIVFAAWTLTYALFFLAHANAYPIYHMLWALVLITISFRRGPIYEKYGTFQAYIR